MTPDFLAPNFLFSELTDSANHPELVKANRMWVLADVRRVVALTAIASMLQLARNHFGSPVRVHSGARSPALNTAVGGRPDSQHMLCEAVDFDVPGVPLSSAFEWIWKYSGLRFGQCLLEGVGSNPPSWIHLSMGEPWRDVSRSRQHSQIDASTNTRVSPG